MHAPRVHVLFVDEEDKTFAVGVVARADEWSVVRDRWRQTLAEHSWPPDNEIKWHGTRTGEVPPALADSVFGALAGAPLTCYVVLLRPSPAVSRTRASSRRTRTPTRPR
jgi:hypothetical protein